MTGRGYGRQRVRVSYVEQLVEVLSARDWAIISTVARLRLVSGLQIERLHFSQLPERSRSVMRWRILKRLTDARVLAPLDRRIGTARHGSAKLCYALDSAGLRLVRLQANHASPAARVRRPRVPGERFVAHTLAITELYVALVEHSRLGRFTVAGFQAEAAWPNGLGGWLRPDALVQLQHRAVTDYWWYEADLATESLPTIRAKLLVYLDFVHRGQLGPDGIVPRVLIGVPTGQRLAALRTVVNALPSPAAVMFLVALMPDVPLVMADELVRI
jgi:hypothetical protein